jgi:DNA-binding NarL/FixJ family response regulator
MNQQYNPIRILLADDHEIFREGFDTLLKKQNDIVQVGEATNGLELVQLTEKFNPDVILTDIQMPEMDGIEATKKISLSHPHIHIIALTMFEDEHYIVEMLECGAHGYLLKNSHKSEVFEAIRSVYRGETYYCKKTSAKLVQMIGSSRFDPFKHITKINFTPRETDIIILICKEFSNKEMADHLSLSIRTVEGYREKIQEKMKVKNTAGIVVYAIRHGLFKV